MSKSSLKPYSINALVTTLKACNITSNANEEVTSTILSLWIESGKTTNPMTGEVTLNYPQQGKTGKFLAESEAVTSVLCNRFRLNWKKAEHISQLASFYTERQHLPATWLEDAMAA